MSENEDSKRVLNILKNLNKEDPLIKKALNKKGYKIEALIRMVESKPEMSQEIEQKLNEALKNLKIEKEDDDKNEDVSYFYNEKGELVDKLGNKFKFINQAQYDRVGDYVLQYIENQIENVHKAKKIKIPVKSPKTYVYISPNYDSCEVCVFLIQGSGVVRYELLY
jgi:NADH dehydrogenase/NADH:ubiquinone oxidoreductase subunit G